MKQYDVPPRPARRRMVENKGSVEDAREIRRKFYDREPESEQTMRWEWPKSMVEVGSCEAVMYSSDKWRSDGRLIDYKHVAESPQSLLVIPGFIEDYFTGEKLDVCGPSVPLNLPMPTGFAVLAKMLAVQAKLFEEGPDGEVFMPNGNETLYQIDLKGAHLGGARHPETNEPFLLIYTDRGGVCALVTGQNLDIHKDGIVG